MYFIQSGKISVIDETKSVGAERYVKEVLHTKDCFGLVSILSQRNNVKCELLRYFSDLFYGCFLDLQESTRNFVFIQFLGGS